MMDYRIKAVLIRAVKTFFQTFASMVVVGAGFEDLNWVRILSVSAVSFIASLATNLAGTPETNDEGTITYSKDENGNPIAEIKSDKKFEDLYASGKQYVVFKIVDNISNK